MAEVTNSATSDSVDLTVNCIVIPSESTNFALTKISAPPRNIPINIKNKN